MFFAHAPCLADRVGSQPDSLPSYTSADEATFPLAAAMALPPPAAHDPVDPGTEPALVVFSGGTAFNSVASHLRQLSTRVTHVLPVSDDGGSTAEIVRVLGGPAVGDIRSRCLRLADGSDAEAEAVRLLLAHRLPSSSAAAAKREWYDIVEGEHALWEVSYMVFSLLFPLMVTQITFFLPLMYVQAKT